MVEWRQQQADIAQMQEAKKIQLILIEESEEECRSPE